MQGAQHKGGGRGRRASSAEGDVNKEGPGGRRASCAAGGEGEGSAGGGDKGSGGTYKEGPGGRRVSCASGGGGGGSAGGGDKGRRTSGCPIPSKPLAIRVSSVGGTTSPFQEAMFSIRGLVTGTINLSPGYDSYTQRLLPLPTEYDYASHDDLSADEAFELPAKSTKLSNWRKVRNIVQWTPFIQTYKKHKYPWVQLAGHQGNFRAGYKQGTILKKLCPAEEKALDAIMVDVLRPYVPRYTGVIEGTDREKYLQLEDLLSSFTLPCVMDIKMGVRTYLEDELAKAREKPKLRKDMYEKMVQIDPKAPTEAELRAKAVTKPRYMVWRETISSTATQGFRIEGVRRGDGTSSKDFKTTRTRDQVRACLSSFLQGYSHAASRYVQQLKSIKVTLEASTFFKSHELIGSSLLFVHNETSALVRMIDFAKTIPLPENVSITHRSPWSEGTHEDGYLLGLDNLIELFVALEKTLTTNGSASPISSPVASPVTPSSLPSTSPTPPSVPAATVPSISSPSVPATSPSSQSSPSVPTPSSSSPSEPSVPAMSPSPAPSLTSSSVPTSSSSPSVLATSPSVAPSLSSPPVPTSSSSSVSTSSSPSVPTSSSSVPPCESSQPSSSSTTNPSTNISHPSQCISATPS